MENRIITVVILILFVLAIAWFSGCFDSDSPPRTYPIVDAEAMTRDFSALSDGQQSEVVELFRRSSEINDIRKFQVQLIRLHVSLLVRQERCAELQDSEPGARLNVLMKSILSTMSVSMRLLDSVDPRLQFVPYTESVEHLRKLQTEALRECGLAIDILLRTGCIDQKLQDELQDFNQST